MSNLVMKILLSSEKTRKLKNGWGGVLIRAGGLEIFSKKNKRGTPPIRDLRVSRSTTREATHIPSLLY